MTFLRRVSDTNLLLAVMAAGLLTIGIPQTADSVVRLFAGGGDDLSQSGTLQTIVEEAQNGARLEKADVWFNDPNASIRAGTTQFLLALSQPQADQQDVRHAIADLETGLAREPANAKAWIFLGLARFQVNDIEGAELALRTSILIAPYDPTLLIARSDLGLRLISSLSAEDWQLVSEQIRMAADHQFDNLVALATASSDTTPIMSALANDPDRAADLLRALASR